MLDVYQVKAGKVSGENTSIPVIHFTELLAFSMGHFNTRLAQLKTRISVIGN